MDSFIDNIIIPIIVAVAAKLIVRIIMDEGSTERELRQKIKSWLRFLGPDTFSLYALGGALLGALIFGFGLNNLILGYPNPITVGTDFSSGSEVTVGFLLGMFVGGGLGAHLATRFFDKEKLSWSDTIDYALLVPLLGMVLLMIIF